MLKEEKEQYCTKYHITAWGNLGARESGVLLWAMSIEDGSWNVVCATIGLDLIQIEG